MVSLSYQILLNGDIMWTCGIKKCRMFGSNVRCIFFQDDIWWIKTVRVGECNVAPKRIQNSLIENDIKPPLHNELKERGYTSKW
jgi:hypothetical protein